MVGYTAGQYLDTPPGFAVYPGPRHLDKVTQEPDIAGHFQQGSVRDGTGYTASYLRDPQRFT